jgi:hypothetical protein
MKIETTDLKQETNDIKLGTARLASMEMMAAYSLIGNTSNPWSPSDVDKMELGTTDYQKIVKACRFFYQKDPIASSTINKLVEIGINDIVFAKNGLSDNEFRIFEAIEDMLEEFAEVMTMEYLISGLVVPEIKYARVSKDKLKRLGIKKYDSLMLPITMFVRDPETIIIKQTPLGDKPAYFVKIPGDLIFFIKSKGKFPDGTSDPEVYNILTSNFPDFVKAVEDGATEIRIEDDTLIIRRKPQPNDPYPIPYLSAALESLKHKRNLRRMDYALASRVIGAIQLFRLGDKDFPVTEDDKDDQFNAVKQQILWRDGSGKDIERIFQLFANHTLQIDWVMPDTSALLDESKYTNINQDIIYSLGFPRILITGETEKSSTSQPEYAMMSPAKTMENFRRKILEVLEDVVNKVAEFNNLKTAPEVDFKPLTLFDYQTLLKSLADLYAGGNISRTTYAETLGYVWEDEMEQKAAEQKTLKEKELGEFAPLPNGVQPTSPNDNNTGNKNIPNKPEKTGVSDIKNQSNNQNGVN